MLDQVREFHGQLAEYYGQLSDKAAQQRLKMLLDHMSSHEKHLQTSLAAYEEDASRQVMDTYVDCAYCDEIMATCEQTPVTPQMNVNRVIKIALDVDNCLLRFYREVAANADSETVREVFRNLIDMEEGELRKLAMNALGAQDM
jgi:rubrerythrin